MLTAEDATSGVQARLLLIPLGQQVGGSLSADDLLLADLPRRPDPGP